MKIEISNSATRFLALSAIALTLSSAPSRADWTTVRPDGSVVTVPHSLKVGDDRAPENPSTPSADGPDDYSSDDSDLIPTSGQNAGRNTRRQAATYDGPRRAPSERVQRNRNRVRNQNANRRARSQNGNAGTLEPLGGLSYGAGVGFNSYPSYPGYPAAGYGYSTPAYPYGYPAAGYGSPYGYGGTSVVAPGATIVLPQTPFSVPIAPGYTPNVPSPVFTSIPVGGTTIITGNGSYPYGVPYGAPYGDPYAVPHNAPGYYPPAHPPRVPHPRAIPHPYPYGYPQSYSYPAYPNGTVTQSYGGLSISRGGIGVSIGGSSTSTQSTWGTGLYR